jgi:hypothetical protein
MTKWHELQPADETFFETAPHVYRYPIDLPVPAERVWESLTSDRSVAAWGLGVGTTREVVLPLHSITVREEYVRWDEGKGYSFYVRAANRPVLRRMAENYELEPTATGCLFTWTFAVEPTAKTSMLLRLGGPVNQVAFGQMARSSKTYFAKHPLHD